MSENVLETVRATVQDFLAPEIRTHGVRLDNIERRIDEMRGSLEHRIEDAKETLRAEIKPLGGRIEDSKETLRAEMKSIDARIDDTKETLRAEMRAIDARLGAQLSVLDGLVRQLIQQVTVENSLRERVASIEARLPKQ